MKGKVIYSPSGKAGEYAALAANLYTRCSHGCTYCYCPSVLKVPREHFHNTDGLEDIRPRENVVSKIADDIKKYRDEIGDQEILLSFMCDVYQPAEFKYGVTREVIKLFIENDIRFTILTKAGFDATRDIDLLQGYDKCSFGSSITLNDPEMIAKYEPNAASYTMREHAIYRCKFSGIKTWVSMEPVIDPVQALEIIYELAEFVDHWKIGKLNYQKLDVDWIKFREDVIKLLESEGASYYIKKSLSEL